MEVPLGSWGVQHHSPRDSGGVRPTCASGNGGCGTSRDPWEAPPLSATSREHLRRQTRVVTYRRERLVNPAFQKGSIAPQSRKPRAWTHWSCVDSLLGLQEGQADHASITTTPRLEYPGGNKAFSPGERESAQLPQLRDCQRDNSLLQHPGYQIRPSRTGGRDRREQEQVRFLEVLIFLSALWTLSGSLSISCWGSLTQEAPTWPVGTPSTLPALPTPPRLSERLPLRAPEGEMWRARGHELWESFGIYRGSQQRGEEVTATSNVKATRKSKKREQSRKCDTTKG